MAVTGNAYPGEVIREPTIGEVSKSNPTSSAHGCGSSISWEDAGAHIGEVTNVEGPVVSTYYATESERQPTFLNMGRDHPDPDRVTALIWGEDRSRFTGPPEQTYRNERVCVTGRLELYEGVPEIIVSSPSDISVLTSSGS